MRHTAPIVALGSAWVFLSLPHVRADDATAVDSAQATVQAQQQMAQAQAMADAALARAAQQEGGANIGSSTARVSNSGSPHHTMGDLIQNNSLRPDHSDPKHHRMGELL
jgi:hypothetical protein